jgi:hypothetical protein
MQNIEMSVENNTLTIKIDLSKNYGPSNSGKTEIVATTSGNQSVPETTDIKIGINCYKKIKKD